MNLYLIRELQYPSVWVTEIMTFHLKSKRALLLFCKSTKSESLIPKICNFICFKAPENLNYSEVFLYNRILHIYDEISNNQSFKFSKKNVISYYLIKLS